MAFNQKLAEAEGTGSFTEIALYFLRTHNLWKKVESLQQCFSTFLLQRNLPQMLRFSWNAMTQGFVTQREQ